MSEVDDGPPTMPAMSGMSLPLRTVQVVFFAHISIAKVDRLRSTEQRAAFRSLETSAISSRNYSVQSELDTSRDSRYASRPTTRSLRSVDLERLSSKNHHRIIEAFSKKIVENLTPDLRVATDGGQNAIDARLIVQRALHVFAYSLEWECRNHWQVKFGLHPEGQLPEFVRERNM
jgi:hypothetical protein